MGILGLLSIGILKASKNVKGLIEALKYEFRKVQEYAADMNPKIYTPTCLSSE